ncbi:hypothetical protein ACFOYW_09535 [Gryllotalpicola reticulitermitis]|uniref:Uncharacterized protein n=1 Tax=Gryllotalpicola reticulitermitis TaxID=1184153 RepID=A0ABV8Q7N8_9MICO
MSESHEADTDKMPADEELQEPSTEKEPGDEPKDGDDTPDEVDHEAVGVGVVEHEPVESGSSDGNSGE